MTISVFGIKSRILKREHLPSGLVVTGSLDLNIPSFDIITQLPDNLTISGGLFLVNQELLTYLPKGLVVKGYLYLKGCTSLIGLPMDIVVNSMIICDEFFIEKIPFEELPLYISFPFERHIHEHIRRRLHS
jgi:hypothetical protein